MDWSKIARETITKAAATIDESATLKERMKAIDAAYPFGERAYWPYKAWLKARKDYLIRYGYRGGLPPSKPIDFGPLFEPKARD